MVKKELKWRGKDADELKGMDLKEFALLLPTRQRRSLLRGRTDDQQILMKKLQKKEKNIETHCRDMIIIPIMLGTMIKVHNGKELVPVNVELDMLGHYLGEFALTRRNVQHSAPGVGATRSSAAISVK